MESILVKNNKIYLDTINPQISPLGREFRLSGISIDVSKQPKYIDKMYKHCTSYIFIYTDNQELFGFYFDEYNNFKHKLNHEEVQKLK